MYLQLRFDTLLNKDYDDDGGGGMKRLPVISSQGQLVRLNRNRNTNGPTELYSHHR